MSARYEATKVLLLTLGLSFCVVCLLRLVLNAPTNPVAGPVLLRLVDPISPYPTHWQGTLLINGDTLEVLVVAKNPNRRTEP